MFPNGGAVTGKSHITEAVKSECEHISTSNPPFTWRGEMSGFWEIQWGKHPSYVNKCIVMGGKDTEGGLTIKGDLRHTSLL